MGERVESAKQYDVTNDPREDTRLRVAFSEAAKAPPIEEEHPEKKSTKKEYHYILDLEMGWKAAAGELAGKGWEDNTGVTVKKNLEIPSEDGKFKIPVDVYTPSEHEPKDTIVHYHGGGMMLLSKDLPVYVRTAKELARAGVRVVLPEFTSALKEPFPRGLHDCYSTAMWAADKYGAVILFGDSGGGNLSFAVALLAKERKTIGKIKGIYTLAPHVWGSYPTTKFPSLVNFKDYGFPYQLLVDITKIYTPDPKDAKSPLAFPAEATVEELKGLPPCVVHVDELDMVTDAATFFYRRLLEAGVKARHITSGGLAHIADLYHGVLPDVAQGMVALVKSFVSSI